MKHKLTSSRLVKLVKQWFVVWEFSAGAVGDRTPVGVLGCVIMRWKYVGDSVFSINNRDPLAISSEIEIVIFRKDGNGRVVRIAAQKDTTTQCPEVLSSARR